MGFNFVILNRALLSSALGIVMPSMAMPSAPSGVPLKGCVLGGTGCSIAAEELQHSTQQPVHKAELWSHTAPTAALCGAWLPLTHSAGSSCFSSLRGPSQTCPSTPQVSGPSLHQVLRTSCGLFFRYSPADVNICCHRNCQHFSCLCLYLLQNNGRS